MTLPKQEADLFFKIYIPLLGYANQYDGKGEKRTLDKAREILYGNPQIIEDFVSVNPEKLNKEQIRIVDTWRNFVKGDFVLIRSLKKYNVLLNMGNGKAKAYGILGLNDSPIDMAAYGVGTYFERVVLLPWKDKIIWDGLVYQKPVILGRNYMRSFTEDYMAIKQRGEIIENIKLSEEDD